LHYPGNAKTFYFTIAERRQKSSPSENGWLQWNSWAAVRNASVCCVAVILLVF